MSALLCGCVSKGFGGRNDIEEGVQCPFSFFLFLLAQLLVFLFSLPKIQSITDYNRLTYIDPVTIHMRDKIQDHGKGQGRKGRNDRICWYVIG